MLMLGMVSKAQLEALSFEEYNTWLAFFDQRPIGWRDDLRFSQLLKAFGDKRKPTEMFSSIKAVMDGIETKNNMNLRNSFIFQKVLSAKGGEKLDILETL